MQTRWSSEGLVDVIARRRDYAGARGALLATRNRGEVMGEGEDRLGVRSLLGFRLGQGTHCKRELA